MTQTVDQHAEANEPIAHPCPEWCTYKEDHEFVEDAADELTFRGLHEVSISGYVYISQKETHQEGIVTLATREVCLDLPPLGLRRDPDGAEQFARDLIEAADRIRMISAPTTTQGSVES